MLLISQLGNEDYKAIPSLGALSEDVESIQMVQFRPIDTEAYLLGLSR